MPNNLLTKNEPFGSMRLPTAILFLWDALFSIVWISNISVSANKPLFFWINILTILSISVLLFIGKKNIWILIPLGIRILMSVINLFTGFNVVILIALLSNMAIFLIAASSIIPALSQKTDNLPKFIIFIPAALFLASDIYIFITTLSRYGNFASAFLSFLNNGVSVLCYAFFAITLTDTKSKETPVSAQPIPVPISVQPTPTLAPAVPVQRPQRGVLLVRFSIDKLNELSGSYGFQSGKLIGRAVPPELLEGTIISDGDSAATLAGKEYVCVVSIASEDSSLLRDKIEPLILASEEIRTCGAYPLTQIVPNTREPLVVDGVVRGDKIVGAGGWCASGFMNAWKEATEAPVHEVKAEASAVIPPTQGENEEKSMSASEIANLVDKLAHFSTFGMDRSEEEKMGAELLKCGDKALKAIVNYLILCASGRQRDYWWSNASYLVKMIKEFPGADFEQIYNTLINQSTNIWEYHTQIKEVAEQELLNYKKSSPDYDKSVIPDVDARAELNALFNSGGSVESRLEKAIAMRASSEAWSNENKAYYYYILGYYVQYLSSDDTKALPFYAAQVFYRPDRTTAGWDKIQSISAFKDVSRTVETAELFHEMYPIPENWDYLLKLN